MLSGLQGSVFEGVTCRGGVKSSSDDDSEVNLGRTKEKIKCCKRGISLHGEGALGLRGGGLFGAGAGH